MKNSMFRTRTIFLVIIGLAFVSSCRKDTNEIAAQTVPRDSKPEAYISTLIDHPGRRLAANCFQCHGTDGFAGELKIASMGSTEILSKMNSFRLKDPKSDIMNFHAQAYTTNEINLIADYFSKQN